MKSNNCPTGFSKVGMAIGVGLLAGLAGTVVMTVCQRIDMKLTGRKGSTTPAKAVKEALDIQPVSESKSKQFSNEVHWVYGTSLGLVRGLIYLLGIKRFAATSAHFGAVWATELIMLPSLRVAPPVTKESAKTIAKDAMYHGVYAAGAGLVFDAILNEG